jgi:large subunit ribosomal protein L9
MKVILKEYVYMQGVAGDIVDVADGFARNYLIPRGKAVKATPTAIKRNQELMEQVATRRKELTSRLMEVSQKIDGTELVFGRKAGRNNQLYGSVTTRDIAQALLDETGVDIDRRRVSERSLRELGTFEVPIRMGQDLSPVVKVVILPEDEVEEYLRRREAGELQEEVIDDMLDLPEEPEYVEVIEEPEASESEEEAATETEEE